MQNQSSELQKRLEAIRAGYRKKLPARYEKIRELWSALELEWDWDRLDELYRLIHNLAGAGATFGVNELSAQARELCRPLNTLRAERSEPNASVKEGILGSLEALKLLMMPEASRAEST